MANSEVPDRRTPVITIPASWFPYLLLFGGLAGGTGISTVGGALTRNSDVDAAIASAVSSAVKAANADDDVRIQVLEANMEILKQQLAEQKQILSRIEGKMDDLRSEK